MRVEVVGWPRKIPCTKLFANANSTDHKVNDADLEAFMASIPAFETNLVTV